MTLAIEVPAYALMLRGALDAPARAALIAAVVVNLATHPVAFLLLDPGSTPGLIAMEMGIVAVESALLWLWLRRDAGLLIPIATVANGLSFTAGLL